VGVIVWGLTIWCVVAYRRRKDDPEFPEQLRYNVPIEILYTVVPLFMIAVLFFYTARDQTALLDVKQKPDVTVNVVGKQWSWDFNYVEAQTYESGTQAELTGKPGVQKTLPTMYLPVNKRVEFILTARDVIHSFWVPQFSQKQDAVPGAVNKLVITPTKNGTYPVICTELCGLGHAVMRSEAIVVDRTAFASWVKQQQQAAKAGPGQAGLAVYNSNGCGSCHTLAAAKSTGKVGPDLDKLPADAQKAGKPLEDYTRESIVSPNAYIVPGFNANVMPATFSSLPKDQLDSLVSFLVKSSQKGS
jgi:cytochrome c oxidase subunit 2